MACAEVAEPRSINPFHTHGVKRLWNSRLRAASAEPSSCSSINTISISSSCSRSLSAPRGSKEPSTASTCGLTDASSVSRDASESWRLVSEEREGSVALCATTLSAQTAEVPVLSTPRLNKVLVHSKRTHITVHHRSGKEFSPEPRPVVSSPAPEFLLPPKTQQTTLTVVLDLDETLVYNRHSSEAFPRPYLHAVLHGLRDKPDVEVVLWTASTKEVATRVIAGLHEGGEKCCFDHIISRDKLWFTEPMHTKDLQLLGRPMDKILIVENSVNCCKLNRLNSILVDDYHGQQEDSSLVNVYYMIEAIIQLINAGHSVGASLRVLAKENLLCGWKQYELPSIWKRAPLWTLSPNKRPPFGKFVKAKNTYNVV